MRNTPLQDCTKQINTIRTKYNAKLVIDKNLRKKPVSGGEEIYREHLPKLKNMIAMVNEPIV